MRVLVVDDEAPARRRLMRLLAELPDVEVVGEAGDVDAAMRAVEAHRPELLLLDIGMPGMDGLTWVARYAGLPPVVFTTAHDDRALEAFEVHAVDYVLKPIRAERLALALGRARLRLAEPQAPAALEALTTGAPTSLGTRVVVNDRGATRFFDAAEITRFWSSEKYTLFVAEGREQLTAEPLTALETRLAAYGFVRVHRGELVAVPRIRTLSTTDGIAEVELADGQRARVSRRYLGALKAALGLAGD
jgi:DNA-binding LytR/AlgR family response regulator